MFIVLDVGKYFCEFIQACLGLFFCLYLHDAHVSLSNIFPFTLCLGFYPSLVS